MWRVEPECARLVDNGSAKTRWWSRNSRRALAVRIRASAARQLWPWCLLEERLEERLAHVRVRREVAGEDDARGVTRLREIHHLLAVRRNDHAT